MVAPVDPHGINKAGSPRDLHHTIEAWGYIHGRQERKRLFIGGAVFLAACLMIVGAFFLYIFTRSNVHQTTSNLSRSSELSGPELKRLIKDKGIKTVIRLVGIDDSNAEGYEEQTAAVAETDATLVVAKLPSSRMPWRSEMIVLFDALDSAERPIHIHCQAGSDRSGLVSAIWLHDYEGRTLEEARQQLAFFPYGHVAFGAASELGKFLDMYEAYAQTHPGVSIKQWVTDVYNVEKRGREVASE